MSKKRIPLVWFEYFQNLVDLYPLNSDKVIDKFLEYGKQQEEELAEIWDKSTYKGVKK
jgi:hypothetical protein